MPPLTADSDFDAPSSDKFPVRPLRACVEAHIAGKRPLGRPRAEAILAATRSHDRDQCKMTTKCNEVDARGLQCPLPLLKAKQALNAMASGEQLLVLSTDQGSWRDFEVFASQSGHQLLEREENDGTYRYLLQKR